MKGMGAVALLSTYMDRQSGQAFDVPLNGICYHEQSPRAGGKDRIAFVPYSPRAGGKDRIAFVPYLCLISAAVLTCCSIFRFAVLEFFSPVFARLLFCSCYVPSFHT